MSTQAEEGIFLHWGLAVVAMRIHSFVLGKGMGSALALASAEEVLGHRLEQVQGHGLMTATQLHGVATLLWLTPWLVAEGADAPAINL